MFDIGFLELLLVAIAALLLVKPEDWPQLARTIRRAVGEFRQLWQEVTGEFDEAKKQAASTITGLDGKEYIAYDVTEIEALLETERAPEKNHTDDASDRA